MLKGTLILTFSQRAKELFNKERQFGIRRSLVLPLLKGQGWGEGPRLRLNLASTRSNVR
jgi:hypothetical protein